MIENRFGPRLRSLDGSESTRWTDVERRAEQVIAPGGDEERHGDSGEDDGAPNEPGTERLLPEEVDEDLTDLLFQDPPPPQSYPRR